MLVLCWTLPTLGSLLAPVGSLLASFWLPLGSLLVILVPFSRHCLLCWLYVEFSSLLIHCLLPLAHLWLPLVPFWLPLGIFWVLFGAIWFTFAHPMVLFSHFGISQPSVIFYMLLYFQCKSYIRQGFSCKLFIARWRDCGFAALKITTPRPRTSKDRQEPTQNKAHKRRSKTQNTTRHSI